MAETTRLAALWQHTDEDGDQVYLRRDDNGCAFVMSAPTNDDAAGMVYVDRPALLSLYHALGDELARDDA